MKVQAIIFDCFGVLVTESWLAFKEEYFGNDPDRSEQAAQLLKRADRGHITHQQFIQDIAALAGITPQSVERYLDRNSANKALFKLIGEKLKPHFKIGMLSNAADDWLTDLFTEEQLQLFDAVALSYTSGVTKPNTAAYHHIAQALQVPAEECIFIDDQERHCKGAQKAGMHAILYTDVNSLVSQLEEAIHHSL